MAKINDIKGLDRTELYHETKREDGTLIIEPTNELKEAFDELYTISLKSNDIYSILDCYSLYDYIADEKIKDRSGYERHVFALSSIYRMGYINGVREERDKKRGAE